MEKSRSCSQAVILDPQSNHGQTRRSHVLVTMPADSRGTRHCITDGSGSGRRRPLHSRKTSSSKQTGRCGTAIGVRGRGFNTIMPILLILIASLWISPVSAVLVEFQNCLSDAAQKNLPMQLQFVPLFVDASFNTTDPNHPLEITVWGNITGSTVGKAPRLILPGANDTEYWSGNSTINGGKIMDSPFPLANVPKLTTLSNKVNVLTYEPFSEDLQFCNVLINGSCPLGPRFDANESDPLSYPAFRLKNNFFSTYSFTSFAATLVIKWGDEAATPIGCTSTVITPDLGSPLSGVLTYIPAVILIMVAVATAFAAIYSPWGTTDTFRWTTNYGRDADLLRLVTPGFGDCLQYIQFIVLTGGLTLSYPGFYQPVVSKASWSTLMFDESFVRNTTTNHGLVDGIYVVRGTYGLDKLRQLVGLSGVDDVWTGMTVWLLVILAVVLVSIQIGFFIRWAYRHLSDTPEEDLRAKNMPFSIGNVIRIVFNYFLLPIVALSMFQLVVASRSPMYAVALAVAMLVLIIGFAIWLLYVIASTRPKSYLFDDLPTVLLYGSLYNTYSDNAAPFALIPITLTFVRGVTIGAVQPSGIAQIIILAICEVITLLTLHAFRPFHSPTSMNAFHTVFSAVRFASILLMVAFAPSLGVTEGPKSWIGYAILLMHALVLIFGFFLNAIQTIIEVAARLAGAGGDESGAARGGLVKVFGMRQLSKRMPRRDAASRQSQLSSAAMLDAENERKSYVMGDGRNRSQSAGSTILLNRHSTGLDYNVEPFGALQSQQVGGSGGNSSFTATPREAGDSAFLPSAAAPAGRRPVLGLATAEASDPYYRPPRLRRPTLDAYSPGAKSRGSWASGDWGNKAISSPEAETPPVDLGPSISGRNTPTALPGAALEAAPNDPRRSQADYTTREVDFYYGVRGPALNANVPSRRIKTGPADPTGIPASAVGWFKGMFGGKTKEKGKGFEVVRSSRMPPGMQARNAPGQETPPEGIPVATGVVRSGPIDSDDDEPVPAVSKTAGPPHAQDALVSPMRSDEESDGEYSEEDFEVTRISDLPPNLSGLDIPGGGIELPSRFPSKATSKASSRRVRRSENTPQVPGLPSRLLSNKLGVPRRSSRRKSQSVDLPQAGPESLHQYPAQHFLDIGGDSSQVPFDRSNSSKRHSGVSAVSSIAGPSGFSHSRDGSLVMGRFSEDLSDDRPTSMGFVNQHNILTITPSENQQHLGSSAEVVDGRISGASSMEHPRQ